MVLGILTGIAACPAIIGTTEAVRQGQRHNAREKHRGLKTNLSLYLNVPSKEFPYGHPEDHPFAGYFLPFPDHDWGRQGEGMVSTISNDPPQLNWILMDRDTCEVKCGVRIDAEPHIIRPWDVTKMDRRVLLTGYEGFVAVRYGPGEWALYFDVDDNGLQGWVPDVISKIEIELVRREMRQERISTGAAEGEADTEQA